MKVVAVGYSSKGIREHNEDSFLLNDTIGGVGIEDTFSSVEVEGGKSFFAVADGMGGHSAGDVASQFVVSQVKDELSKADNITADSITSLLKDVHKNLLEKGKNDNTPNMGSTFVGLSIGDEECGLVNVGDSRLYRLRNGFIQQLSHDDSLAEIIPNAPKNIVLNAMGAGLEDVQVETRFSKSLAVTGDIFLLCSDGVHGHVTEDYLEEVLSKQYSLIETARQIVEKAIENGSDDNSTAVIVQVE